MKRDYYAGALICLIAAFMGLVTLHGLDVSVSLFGEQFQLHEVPLEIGSIRSVGPGLFPFALICILFVVGLLIAINAGDTEVDSLDHFDDTASKYPDVRGGIAIIAGMLAFVFLTQTLGLVAGTFACVFIAAIGAKDATALGSLALAAVVTVFGVALFIFLLKVNLPLFQFQRFSL